MAVAKLWNGLDALPTVAVLFLDFSIDRSLQYCGATCSPCSPAQSPCNMAVALAIGNGCGVGNRQYYGVGNSNGYGVAYVLFAILWRWQ
jgi:hypothetical protein